jgi:hypothetical protein
LTDRNPLSSQTNGAFFVNQNSRPDLTQRRTEAFTSTSKSTQAMEAGYLVPARVSALIRKDSNVSDSGSVPDSLIDLYGSHSANRSGISSTDLGETRDIRGEASGSDEDPEQSSWIHRDKLARIESQELQAAGIILPRTRAPSRSSRRERSTDQQGNGIGKAEQQGQFQKRQRIESSPVEEVEDQDNSWDLRRPEEVADEVNGGYKEYNVHQKGMSRIPVCKTSPLPIPFDYLERDTPTLRNRSNGWNGDEDAILYPKSRSRSQSIKMADESASTPTPAKRLISDASPSKKATAPVTRKASVPATRTSSAQSRPKTRTGPKDTANSRPPTRSGEASSIGSTKRPEGDPPWLASMYKPDPRLPPDQQLLPTVAKRLQQEQWEKEGKFGNVYDKEFRPLNDEKFHEPEGATQAAEAIEQKPEEPSEWPLRIPKSPTLSTGRPGTASGGYSTMPKIQDIPQSPLTPKAAPIQHPLGVQEPPGNSKEGCGCCIVM